MRHEQGAVGEWSFGDLRANGKPHYKGVNVERIVATAFHGAVSDDYSVVDHIDGNLENNRPENLRWLSPLEDILDNPETIKAINDLCGGFDSFLTAKSFMGFEYLNIPEAAVIGAEKGCEWIYKCLEWYNENLT